MFRLILHYRGLVVTLFAVLSIFFAFQLPKLVMDSDTEAYVPHDHPIRVFWNEAEDRFGLGREILIAVQVEGETDKRGIFTPQVLSGIASLTEGIKALAPIEESLVISLSDADAMVGTEDGFEVTPLFTEPPETQAEADSVREAVFRNSVYIGRLVSSDASIAAILVKSHRDYENDPMEVYRSIEAYVSTVTIPGTRILIAGSPAVEAVYGEQMATDLAQLIPLAILVVAGLLYVCFRDLRGVVLPLVVVLVAVLWTLGAQAAAGMPIYIAGTLVPPLLLAIGCADAVHILERYLEKAEVAAEPNDAILATVHELWRPVVITSLTTAAGFSALMVSSMTVYQVFGVTTAFGILIAMLGSLFLLPALLSYFPLPARGRQRQAQMMLPRVLAAMAVWLERHRRKTVGVSAAIAVVLLMGVALLRVDFSWVETLQEGTPVLTADRILREKHGGTMPLSIIVRAREEGGVKSPEFLRAIDQVLTELSLLPAVGDTRSIAEYIKRMNQTMHADRASEYRIPETQALVAQYLLLYSISGDPDEYEDMVDYDYSAAHLAILLRSDRMSVIKEVSDRAEELFESYLEPIGATATMTGAATIQQTVLSMILQSQVSSLLVATIAVLALLLLVFRSLRDALICMIPSTVATIANFGGMGLLGLDLGPDKAMISAIALGIGIDYAIHLMSRFRDLLAEGRRVPDAITTAMAGAGRGVLYTGVVVVAGFSVFAASTVPSNVSFGLLVAANMTASCIAALVLMPAVLAIVGHRAMERAQAAPVRMAGIELDARTARSLGVVGEEITPEAAWKA
jgi:predicted RND superfamily exporter protein